jgi:hypothetical protein
MGVAAKFNARKAAKFNAQKLNITKSWISPWNCFYQLCLADETKSTKK